MSVHQIDEFYIHIKIPEDKIHVIVSKLIEDCMSYDLSSDYLIVEEFATEGEAEHYENELQELLN